MTAAELRTAFAEKHGRPARLFRAPGRVNLIGEHTDYNAGFVMPAAIDLGVTVAAAARADRRVRLSSVNLGQEWEFSLDEANPSPHGRWTDYVQGVAVELHRSGHEPAGMDLMIAGDVPVGGGLSSSGALTVASGFALAALSGLKLTRLGMALLCQRAENDFAGIRCGIMDQFTSCLGRKGHLIMLDCRRLQHRYLRLPSGLRLVVCDTRVKHSLADGAYNQRRADCEEGSRRLGVPALRDLSMAEFERRAGELPAVIHKRCRHVIGENARVRLAAAALDRGDLAELGRLMWESHRSLRDDYEVSCPELDLMVDLARLRHGVWGARMTGGGFGGCTVNLVAVEAVDEFRRSVAAEYRAATGVEPAIHVCRASGAAGEIEPPRRKGRPQPVLLD